MNLELDPEPIRRSALSIEQSLVDLKRALSEFSYDPAGKIKREFQGAHAVFSTSLATIRSDVTNMIKETEALTGKSFKAGEAAGKSLGNGFRAGAGEAAATMRAETQKLQLQFERAVELKAKFKEGVLDRLKAQGVNIGPALKGGIYDVKQVEKEGREFLAAIRKANADVASEMASGAKLSAAADKARVSGTLDAIRVRNRFQAELESANEKLAGRLKRVNDATLAGQQVSARGLLEDKIRDDKRYEDERLALAKLTDKNLAISARGLLEDKIRDDKRYEDERLALTKRTNALIVKDAAFSSASPASQLKTASVAASAIAGGMPVAAATGRYGPAAVAADLGTLKKAADEASGALKTHTNHANDLHSAYRGLASGFGAMWLTWGSVLPLLAGAAVSHGVRSVVEMGAAVDHTLRTIQVLSVESGTAVEGLNAQLMSLARTGPFGPLEIAEAMKTLSLAGLNATEVSAAIKDVLNLSEAGDTSIAKSADVLTSVATAFGVAAEGYNYVGDIIAKTAAVSKASTESIGEAFKTSSTLGKQFGVSLEDVGVGLAALSNLGIRGSAAGTGLRNMYVDLGGRTKQAAALIKSLNLDLRDQHGNMRDIITITGQVGSAMQKLKPGDSKNLFHDLFSERGSKPFVELWDMAVKKSKDSGYTVQTELESLRNAVLDSAGFVAVSAAKMAMTPLNQMRSVSAGLQASLVEAFNGIEPLVLDLSAKLRGMFASEEFRGSLQELMGLLGSLTATLADHIGIVIKVAEAYVAFKVVQAVGGIFGSLGNQAQLAGKQLGGMSQSMVAAAGAQAAGAAGMAAVSVAAANNATAVGGAARAAGAVGSSMLTLGKMLPVIGTIVQVAAGAWLLYEMYLSKSEVSGKSLASSSYSAQLVEKLNAETARLNENTQALRENISVQELRARKEVTDLAGKAKENSTKDVIDAQKALYNETKKLADFEKTAYSQTAQGSRGKVNLVENVAKAQATLAGARKASEIAELDVMHATIRTQTAARLNARALSDKAKAEREAATALFGNMDYTPDGGSGKGKGKGNPDYANAKSELDAIQKAHKAATDRMDLGTKASLDLQKFYHDANITDFQQYQSTISQIQSDAYSDRRTDLNKQLEETSAAQDKLVAAARANPKKAGAVDSDIKIYKAEVEELENKLQQLDSANTGRLQGTFLESARAAITLNKESDKTLDGLKAATALEVENLKIKNDTVAVTELGRYAAEKEAYVQAGVLESSKAINKEIAERQGLMSKLLSAGVFNDMDVETPQGKAAKAVYDQLIDSIVAYQAEGVRAEAAIGAARAAAFDDKKLLEFLDPKKAQTFADVLKGAFGEAGEALGKMGDALQDYAKGQEKMAAMQKALAGRKDLSAADRIVAETKLGKKQVSDQIEGYGAMAGAAKNFFSQKTVAYKVLSGIETGMHMLRMYQMGMELYKTLFVTTAKVTGNAVVGASGVASDAIQLPGAVALANVKAVGAVANQGGGDPYTAFPRIAAMIAVMAGIGLMLGAGGGGAPSVSYDAFSNPDKNKANTGTLAKDSLTQSQSIADSLSNLEAMAKPELSFTSQMVKLLQSIDMGLSGTTNAILASGFDLSGSSFKSTSKSSGGGIVGAIFGSKSSSTSLEDLGLSFAKQTVAEAIRGVSVTAFQVVKTEWTKSGFLGIGSKSGTDYSTSFSSVDAKVRSSLTGVVENLVNAVGTVAIKLGSTPEQVASLQNIDTGLGKVSLKDLSGTDAKAVLSAVFSALGDSLALAVLPSLDAFNLVGEGYLETLTRVASGMEEAALYTERLGLAAVSLNDLRNKQGDVGAELLRQSITDAEEYWVSLGKIKTNFFDVFGDTSQDDVFGGAGPEIDYFAIKLSGVGEIIKSFTGSASDLADLYTSLVNARTALVAMGFSAGVVASGLLKGAGGMEALTTGLEDFQAGFLSASEQLAVKQARMDAEFSKLGMVTPESAEGFKNLVLGLKSGGDASAEMLGRVLVLSGGMTDLFDGLEGSLSDLKDSALELQIEIMRLEGKDGEANYAQRAFDTQDFSAAEIALYDYNVGLQKQVDVLTSLKKLGEDAVGLQIQIMRLEGKDGEANYAQRLIDTKGMGAAEIAVYDYNEGLRDQVKALTSLKKLGDEAVSLQIEMMRLEGRTGEADGAKRLIDTDGFSATEIAAYDLNTALRKQVDAFRLLKQSMEGLATKSLQARSALMLAMGDKTGSARITRTLDTVGYSAAELALYDYNLALGDSTAAVTEAMAAVTAAREKEVSTMGETVTKLEESVTKFKDFAKSLREFREGLKLSALSPMTPGQRYTEAQTQFNAAVASGDSEKLQSASTALLEASKVYNASNSAYTSDFDRVQAALTLAADNASASASVAQLQLDAAKGQLTALESIDAGVKTLAQAMSDLAVAQAAATALLNNAPASVLASGGALASAQSYSLNWMETAINENLAAGYTPDQIISGGMSNYGIAEADIRMAAKVAGIPGFRIGTNYVPRDMLAQIHEGEAIVPKAYNPAAGGQQQSNAALEAKLEAVLAELRTLREQNNQGHAMSAQATVMSSAKNADTVTNGLSKDKWSKQPELA